MGAMVRMYTGPDGQTRLDDASHFVKPGGTPDAQAMIPAKGIILRHWTGQSTLDWHPAPRRQFVIILGGEMEIETGDGTKRRFKVGDVVLAEDTSGQGHITRRSGEYRVAVIPLA